MAGMPQTKINVCAGKGSKLVAWAFPLLLIALGARPGFSQTRPTEKPFSLAHFRPEQIDINDRSPSLPKELVAIAGKNRGRSNDWIRSLSFSPDGRRIACAGARRGPGKRVPIWDSSTLREVAAIEVKEGTVQQVAFAPNGTSIAILNSGLVWLYDVAAPQPAMLSRLESNDFGEESCVFSPDGTVLATAGREGKIRIWDMSLPKPKATTILENQNDEPSDLLFVAFAPNGKSIISRDSKERIISWDLTAHPPKELIRIEGRPLGEIVDWLKDGNTWLSFLYGDNTVRFLQPTKNEFKVIAKLQVKTGGPHSYIRCVAPAPDGMTLAISVWSERKEAVEIWEFDGRQAKLRRVHEVSYSPYPMVFSPDGKMLVGGVGTTVQLFDPNAETLIAKVKDQGHTMAVRGVAFFPDGKTLVTASEDKTIRFWDVTGPKPKEINVLMCHSNSVTSIAISPDGKYLASTGESEEEPLLLWELDGPAVRKKIALKAPVEQSHSIIFSRDAKLLLAACRDTENENGIQHGVSAVWLWDLKAIPPKLLVRLKGSGAEGFVAISPDGKTVTSGNAIWHLGTLEKRPLDVLFYQTELAFSTDRKTLAGSVGYKTVGLVDMAKPHPEVIRNLEGPVGPTAVAYSPDGKKLATAGEDGKIFVWETTTWRKLHEWTFPGSVYGIAFAPDSHHLATANGNGTAYILRLKE